MAYQVSLFREFDDHKGGLIAALQMTVDAGTANIEAWDEHFELSLNPKKGIAPDRRPAQIVHPG